MRPVEQSSELGVSRIFPVRGSHYAFISRTHHALPQTGWALPIDAENTQSTFENGLAHE
jgi:hypothetical protein